MHKWTKFYLLFRDATLQYILTKAIVNVSICSLSSFIDKILKLKIIYVEGSNLAIPPRFLVKRDKSGKIFFRFCYCGSLASRYICYLWHQLSCASCTLQFELKFLARVWVWGHCWHMCKPLPTIVSAVPEPIIFYLFTC